MLSGGKRRYAYVCLILSSIPLIYYFIILKNGPRMINTAFEYFSFIALIGSLFIVSGGIHIRIKGRSTPHANVILLAIGAVISNFLGTTGASMVLIRPYIRVNRYRISGYHIVFFIFIVSNIGGLLTPIGDPPLFLGYLKGVPFFWVITRVWLIWIIAVSFLLLIFYIIDYYNYKKLPDDMEHEVEAEGEHAFVEGLHNSIFLMIIIGAVFLKEPVREMVMIFAAVASYFTTKKQIHEKNQFTFTPIQEVAILFAAIFATMVPALDWLELNALSLGISEPGHYYWCSGILSSILDNAPTYLNFLSASFGLHGLSVDNPMHMQAMLGMLSSSSNRPPAVSTGNPSKAPDHGILEIYPGHIGCSSNVRGNDLHRKRPEFHGQIHCRASEGEDAALYGIHLFLFDPRADTPLFGYLVHILQISLVSKLFRSAGVQNTGIFWILSSGFIKNPTAGMDFVCYC